MIKQFFKFTALFKIQKNQKARITQGIILIIVIMMATYRMAETENGMSSPISFLLFGAVLVGIVVKSATSDPSLALVYPISTRRKVSYYYLLTLLTSILAIVFLALLLGALVLIFPANSADSGDFGSVGNEMLYHSLNISISSFIIFLATITDDSKSWRIMIAGLFGYGLILSTTSFIIGNNFDFKGLIHTLPNNHYLTYVLAVVFILAAFIWYELAIRIIRHKK